MLGHVLLISAQVSSKSGVPVLSDVTFSVFGEAQRAIASSTSGFRRAWSGYISLRRAAVENQQLKGQLDAAQVEIQTQHALAERTRDLERLLDLRDHSNLRTTAAEIIAAGATPDFRTMTIDKGTTGGVAGDMAVIAPGGVVGRVVAATPRTAKVQLLIDRNAAAGAIVERSRAQGVVIGGGDDRLRMEYVSEVADVVVGDVVVTSGIDGIFPKGFVIGRVEAIEKGGAAYKKITVKPAVDALGLEEVLIVLTPTPAHERDGGVE